MDTPKNLFEDMKAELQKQIQDAFKEGARNGAVSTCATLYATMQIVGLEEDNLLFTLLKDIAKKNGCEDLPAVAAKLRKQPPQTNA